jgi:glycosyltransferase involved in cell wall biosynthesis
VPGVKWDEAVPPERVVAALDRATVLLLPSSSEGLGRVVIEAFLRARPVVGARVGGIPDLVHDGENGLLVDPSDPESIAGAAVQVLSDRALAERLGAAGRSSAEAWLMGPEEFARRTRELVERALA